MAADFQAIRDREEEIDNYMANSNISKRKRGLSQELERFLDKLPGSPTKYNACPREIRRFLIWKDEKGRTQVHSQWCHHFGSRERQSCECRVGLAAGSVSSLVGLLKVIFREAGRGDAWMRAQVWVTPLARLS